MDCKKIIAMLLLGCVAGPWLRAGDTEAVLRLRDERKRHPRVCSVAFPGDTKWREAYDAVYSHGAIVENPWGAFRVYMNESQAVDLYLKPEPCMEAAASGFYATPEHIAAGGDMLGRSIETACGRFHAGLGLEVQIHGLALVHIHTESPPRVFDDSTVAVHGVVGLAPFRVARKRHRAHPRVTLALVAQTQHRFGVAGAEPRPGHTAEQQHCDYLFAVHLLSVVSA